MNAAEAYARLRRLGVAVVQTADAATALKQSTAAATKTLTRLAVAGVIRPVRHGLWWVEGEIDPYRLPEYLSAPLASYVSLHTALYLRGPSAVEPTDHAADRLPQGDAVPQPA